MKFKFKVTVQVTRAEPPREIEAKVEGTPLGIVGRLTRNRADAAHRTRRPDQDRLRGRGGPDRQARQPRPAGAALQGERDGTAIRRAAGGGLRRAGGDRAMTGAPEPVSVETDVLVIGSGAAGMYAAIEAARRGAQVLLVDRSLIGRGGATVMAQMTVAVALGEEVPDDPRPSLRRHHRRRPRAVRRDAGRAALRGCAGLHPRARRLGRRLGAQGWAHHRDAGAGPRPAALRLCRFHQYRAGGVEDAAHASGAQPSDPQSRRPVHRRSCGRRRRGHRRGRLSSRLRRAGRHRRQGDHPGDRRTDAALPPQQRLGQYGRRRLRAGPARRRFADRHGIRPVLSDRASGAAARRHGSDHVGSVPLQARRPAPQRLQRRIHLEIRLRRGRQIRAHPRSRDLRHHQGSRGRPRLAAWRRLPVVRALQRGGVARGVRTGDRSAGGTTASISPRRRSRSRRSRIITWAA